MSDFRARLTELENREEFAERHIGPNAQETRAMLAALGHEDLEQLIDEAVPRRIRSERPLALPQPLTEREALERLARIG
jgi:glycine dehydrogenase